MLSSIGKLKPQNSSFAIRAIIRDVNGDPKGFKDFESDSGSAIADFYNQLNGVPKKRKNFGDNKKA